MQPVARTLKKKWIIHPKSSRAEELSKSLRVSALTAQVLVNREITNVSDGNIFLQPKLCDLISPEKFPNMQAAVSRIASAVKNNEKITIYGDYDVDGITAVAILWQLITMLGGNVDYYIPHRVDEGYGLNIEAVESIAKSGTKLVVTVDCGINALEAAERAYNLGMELVITDHHQAGATLPRACTILHPAVENYANPNSCGAMVAFKLAWAIANEVTASKKLSPELRDFMLNATSLAAMGTIADIVDLRGENRILASYGLKTIAESKLCGIQALIETAGLSGKGLDSFDIGFKLAPVLNAAGRMGHARLAVELLTSTSPSKSIQIAEYLKEQNNQRKLCEKKILKQACEMIIEQGLHHPDRKSLVLASDQWHTGVIGIVASRIVDKFYRPTIMLNISNGMAHGSARSIPGFDMLAGIEACSHHLERFGGHKMAAGVTLKTEKIDQFRDELENFAKNNLNDEDVTDKLFIDAIASFNQLKPQFIDELNKLGPFGQGNPDPMFATKGVRLCSPPRKVGANSDHLQITITDNNATVRCIGFGMGKYEKKLTESEFFSIAYQPQLDTYMGNSNVQLVLSDIQFE
jgi:single-stranded-DNA-specific exonuclease